MFYKELDQITRKETGKRMVIDFDYVKEYNTENIQYLLAKCIEAYNNDIKVRME